LDVDYDTSDAVTVIKSGLIRTMYYGVLHPEPEHKKDASDGWIRDRVGEAFLFNVIIGDTSVSFDKKYTAEHRQDFISYSFTRKEKGIWVGEYKGDKTGTGITWAAITSIDALFFNPKDLLAVLGKTFVDHILSLHHHPPLIAFGVCKEFRVRVKADWFFYEFKKRNVALGVADAD